jgi:hypothetical protein
VSLVLFSVFVSCLLACFYVFFFKKQKVETMEDGAAANSNAHPGIQGIQQKKTYTNKQNTTNKQEKQTNGQTYKHKQT